MKSDNYEYTDGSTVFEGYLLRHDDNKIRPGVMISHAWGGLGEYEKEKAEIIAALGYNVLAIDLYGKGVRGKSPEENQELMQTLLSDREKLRRRLLLSLETLKSNELIDENKVAAVGYCFGGLCVLDLARSGATVNGVVSIHGLFNPPENLPNELIKAKILALHGYDDPMAPPESMTALAQEFTDAGVDWQIHAYGLTYHAFTNKAANDPSLGTVFSPTANKRAETSTRHFLEELFT